MKGQQNQAPISIGHLEPGVHRRVTTLVDRGDPEHLVPGTGITMEALHHYQLLGRRLQARAVAAAFAGLGSAIARPVRALFRSLARSRREGQAIRQLAALDDRILNDIGISRDQIPAAVTGLLTRTGPDQRAAAPTRLRPRAVVTVDEDSRRAA